MKYSDRIKRLEDYLLETIMDEDITEIRHILENEEFDPSFSNSYALYYACINEKIEAMKIILMDHRIDPHGGPIRSCLYYMKVDMVKLLLKDKRLDHDKVVNDIIYKEDTNSNVLIDLFNKCKAELRDDLIDEILENS